jgi:hypothetical protein
MNVKTLNHDLEFLENGLTNLNNQTNLSESINNQDVYEIISLTQSMLNDATTLNDSLKIILKLKSQEKFIDLFEYICNNREHIDFSQTRPILNDKMCYTTTTLNEKRILNLFNLDSIINCIMQYNIEYRKYLCKLNSSNKTYLKTYITCLNDTEFYNDCNNLIKSGIFIISLNWISKVADDYKHIWNSLSSIETLLNFTCKNNNWKVTTYGTIANIAFDNDIEKISEIHLIINKFTKLMSDCINNPDGKLKQQFVDDNNQVDEFDVLYKIVIESHEISAITGILFCLYRLSINEKIKLNIFKSDNFIISLKKLIFNGINVEKQYALQLLAQLCFNDQINKEINNDNELIQFLNDLETKKQIDYIKLQKTCKELLWILKNKSKNNDNTRKGHIMISYNTASREMCLKIKNDLELLNFKVWIDVTDIKGSSLESMAQAVENSEFVLIFVTEKYRQSVNCQAEAQYAYKLNKPIIPCILQNGYHNVNGWLGILIGDKIFIDFTKYSFEEAFKRLIKQIDLLSSNKIEININKPSPVDWSDEQVKLWFDNNNLNDIYQDLKPLTGSVLYQLYQIQIHTPEFFYKAITKNESTNLRSVAVFGDLIRKLFKDVFY